MILDVVLDHYCATLGEPDRSAAFNRAGLSASIHKWEAVGDQLTTYATVGMSAYPLSQRDPDHRQEFYCVIEPEHDELASPLAALALYPEEEHVSLDHGHTVPNDAPILAGTKMDTFLVLRSPIPLLPQIALAEGLHVEFLQAIPIFPSERAFKSERGLEALLTQWESEPVRTWDAARKPGV